MHTNQENKAIMLAVMTAIFLLALGFIIQTTRIAQLRREIIQRGYATPDAVGTLQWRAP
jgi:hypothetical protein